MTKSNHKSYPLFKGDERNEVHGMKRRGSKSFVILIQLILAMIMTSCVNEVPYRAEDSEPRLYLNALLQPDSLLTAMVGRTAHFLEPQQAYRLSDAEVTAVVNGTALRLAYDESTKNYHSSYRLSSGDEVTLTARTNAYGTATATAVVATPTRMTITDISTQPFINPGDPVSLATLNDVDSAMLVTLLIDDPAEEANYYRLTIDYYGKYPARYPEGIYGEFDSPSTEEGYYISQEQFYPHYLLTERSSQLLIDSETTSQLVSSMLYMTGENSFLFTDEQLCHEAGKPSIDFLLLHELPRSSRLQNPESGPWTYDYGWDDDFIFPSDTVSQTTYHYHFELEALSEDYYRYLSTKSTYDLTGGGAMVSEPVRIHSNVNTGVGIVGSYCGVAIADSVAIKFEK